MGAHSHHHHGANSNPIVTAAQATAHCLTGCVIGGVAGLTIGVTAGLGVWPTMLLATALGYATGFMLCVTPVMRAEGVGFFTAFRIIWFGEAISIGVMEIVMNAVDYHFGGVQAQSLFAVAFWRGLMFAVPAGFLAAWPVNWFLLRQALRRAQ